MFGLLWTYGKLLTYIMLNTTARDGLHGSTQQANDSSIPNCNLQV